MNWSQNLDKKLLFSVTKKDFKIETFRVSGAGGQHRDKTSNGVRIAHLDSGAVGESRSSRSQSENKKLAFRRLCETETFTKWHRIEAARQLGQFEYIDQQVDKMMADIKVEVKDENGRWIEQDPNVR